MTATWYKGNRSAHVSPDGIRFVSPGQGRAKRLPSTVFVSAGELATIGRTPAQALAHEGFRPDAGTRGLRRAI